jgi:hypothetical protein
MINGQLMNEVAESSLPAISWFNAIGVAFLETFTMLDEKPPKGIQVMFQKKEPFDRGRFKQRHSALHRGGAQQFVFWFVIKGIPFLLSHRRCCGGPLKSIL